MSQENVEVVRRALETWSSGDIDGLIETMDPEVRFDLSERVFNPGVYEAHDGFRRFVQEVDEIWEYFRIEPLEFIDAGRDKVVVSYLVHGRGKGSGVDVELPSTSVPHDGQAGTGTSSTGGLIDRNLPTHGSGSTAPLGSLRSSLAGD